MSVARLAADDVAIDDVPDSMALRRLVLSRSGYGVMLANEHIERTPAPIRLRSLQLLVQSVMLHDAVALFTTLARMPQLEELVLSFVTFRPYEGPLPVLPFRLRRYRFYNMDVSMHSPTQAGGNITGWSLPLAASWNTIRHLSISLRLPHEHAEAVHLPVFPRLTSLELRGNERYGFAKDLGGYTRLIARCPCLRRIALHWVNGADVATDLQLLYIAETPLQAIELTLNPLQNTPPDVDSALAGVIRASPSLRQLRACTVIVTFSVEDPQTALPLARAVCAARRIAFLLTVAVE